MKKLIILASFLVVTATTTAAHDSYDDAYDRDDVQYRQSLSNPDRYRGDDGSTLKRSRSNDRVLRSDDGIRYRRSLSNPDRYRGDDGSTLKRSRSNDRVLNK